MVAANEMMIDDEGMNRIEEVDFVGSADKIGELVSQAGKMGQFDYILSSHNLEHLPNPVLFFQDCGRILKSSGSLIMAIPDKRSCFDYFRPHSTVGQMLEAFYEERARPTFAQIFDSRFYPALMSVNGSKAHGFRLDYPELDGLEFINDFLAEAPQSLRNRLSNDEYIDTHCWQFTPKLIELLILTLRFYGLTSLRVHEIVVPMWHEFFVHLKNDDYEPADADQDAFLAKKADLIRTISDDAAQNSRVAFTLMKERDSLARERDSLAQERDSLDRERDGLAQEKDALAQDREYWRRRTTMLPYPIRAYTRWRGKREGQASPR